MTRALPAVKLRPGGEVRLIGCRREPTAPEADHLRRTGG